MTTVIQPQNDEPLPDPDELPELLPLVLVELDDDEHTDAGSRINVRKNIDLSGLAPVVEYPCGKKPFVVLLRVNTHDPSDGPHSSPGAGGLIPVSIET